MLLMNLLCVCVGVCVHVCLYQLVYYFVTVIAHPPNLGPYEIGSTIALHCSVTPHPGNRVTYQWTDYHPTASITNSDRTSPNATLLILPGHPYKVTYFCHILNTTTQLGVGRITIQVEGNETYCIARKFCRLKFSWFSRICPPHP